MIRSTSMPANGVDIISASGIKSPLVLSHLQSPRLRPRRYHWSLEDSPMKFTFWCYAPALLLIVLGLVVDSQGPKQPDIKYHLKPTKHLFALVPSRPNTTGENL